MKKGKIIFKGNFGEFFGYNILWLILTFCTLGLFGIYLMYWNMKYFVSRLEIEIE